MSLLSHLIGQLRFKGRGSRAIIHQEWWKRICSHLSSPIPLWCFVLVVVLNTFNRVILFLELENYSSFVIQKFLISRQIRKLKEDQKIDHTFVIFLKDINSNIVQLLSHIWLCDPVDCSTPGFPVHHQLTKLAQTHVHPVRSFCLQSSPASGSFPVSQFFVSGGQSIEVTASALVLPVNIQDWFLLGWTGWISSQSQGLSSLLQHHSSKASILRHSAL